MAVQDDDRLRRLFEEFLAAAEQGRDIGDELLLGAGALHADLAAKIHLHRELAGLSRDLGVSSRTPDAAQRLGRFEVLGSLCKGGMSRILLAHDPKLGRRIALKVLDREVLLDKSGSAWILNEARSLALLEHPGVVRVFEVGEAETHSFIAMELLPSPSLEDVIQEWRRERGGGSEAPKSPEVRDLAARLEPYSARIELLARIADALGYCHDHGILHRDIKPQNVLFDVQGWPKLIDFGLAHMEGADEDSRLGLTQALVGTAAHLAPEQVSSDSTGADPRSDQFSFGTLAYQCLALVNPFLRKTRRAILDAVEAADPPALRTQAPALPPDLGVVVHHALARLPEQRYPDMAALARDLRAILASRPISVSAPSFAHLVRLWLRRHRRAVTAAGVALVLALLALVVTWSTTTLQRRDELMRELARIRPETFTGPDEFDGSYGALLEKQRQAQEFDAGFLRGRLWGGLSAEVQRTVELWSRKLGETFEREQQLSRENGVLLQDMIYRRVFSQDEGLCPDCPFNVDKRNRGTVLYPQDQLEGREYSLSLLSQLDVEPPDLASAFLRTTKTELLIPGIYRLQVWEPGADHLYGETFFYLPEGWPEQRRIELRRPRQEFVRRAKEVPETRYPLQGQGKTLRIAKFGILGELITVGEFARFVEETGYRPRSNDSFVLHGEDRVARPLDDPAWVDFESALEFASWAGGRLPTIFELRIAERDHHIVLPEPSFAASGEFLLEIGPSGIRWLRYSDTLRLGMGVLLPGLGTEGEVTVDGEERYVPAGFRLVFDIGRPDAYTELATRPLEIESSATLNSAELSSTSPGK